MSHAPTIGVRGDRPPIALGAGLAVSVLLHLGAAWWLGVIPSNAGPTGRFAPPPADSVEPEEPAPTLGLDLPENASIAWLGVLSDPAEGVAPESETDQAALTPTPGQAPSRAEPAAPAEPPEPAEQADPTEPAETTDPAAPAETAPPLEPVPATEGTVPEPLDLPDLTTDESPEPVLPVPVEAPATEPGPARPDPAAMEPAPADPGPMGPPRPPEELLEARRRAERAESPAEPAAQSDSRPAAEGTPGETDPRAADAAMRRRARELDVSRLGRPLQASGDLRLNTVRPDWSLRVRNAYSPRRNPFVEIRFGADGRVRLARFVGMPDGTRGSGYEEVDQPLLNAVYAWTAEGAAIEKLAGEGPDATLDLVMRFLLVPPVRGDGDEE